ncbi:hypothetical protein H2O64_06600 [Kordia sp. YSTF-M3]|uniref:Uncharacterized protein n=1 Tax=Kordia aestuariivivens TaxID=2759037 RepID=A0ABR7Q771_9FLAO|nr:hypothetical protein [Kordia aestuariivivens]MBC8754333.1 hypothetical protein [Kordia aestuariivivens]
MYQPEQKKKLQNSNISATSVKLHTNKGLTLKDHRATHLQKTSKDIVQRMEVAQLATRRVRNVRFNGFSETLRQLLLRWAVPNGTRIQIEQTDHVGGSFNVRFTNTNGPAISIATARGWIQTAINHQ